MPNIVSHRVVPIPSAEDLEGDPETALLVSLSLPVGESALSSDRINPSFRFLMAHTLTDRLALGYNVGVAWATEEPDQSRRAAFEYTATLALGLLEDAGVFAEVYGAVPSDEDDVHSFDAGVTWLLRQNLQLDAAGGLGLSEAADDWFLGIGCSYRYPH